MGRCIGFRFLRKRLGISVVNSFFFHFAVMIDDDFDLFVFSKAVNCKSPLYGNNSSLKEGM